MIARSAPESLVVRITYPATLAFRGRNLVFNTDNQNSNASLFTYDGDGNPTSYDSSSQNFNFDPEDRLTAIASSPAFAAHYDGDGIRDIVASGGSATYYVDDGGSPLVEETFSGTTATITNAHGYADGRRETYDNGLYYVFAYDPQGNLLDTDESDNNDGTEAYTTEYLYDGFGKKQFSGVVGPDERSGFSASYGGQYGCYTDLSTGLSLLGRRYYDTYNGRFINRDPTGTNGGPNLYGFCGNNPITNADPDGTADSNKGLSDWFIKLITGGGGTTAGTVVYGQNASELAREGRELAQHPPEEQAVGAETQQSFHEAATAPQIHAQTESIEVQGGLEAAGEVPVGAVAEEATVEVEAVDARIGTFG